MLQYLRFGEHSGGSILGVVATFCAASLVLYYQWQAQAALESQTRVVYAKISEQTATDVAQELRRTLDGPVLDTLLKVTHPELLAGRLDLVADAYEDGLLAYPQVQRFFVWSKETEAVAPGEVLFYRSNWNEGSLPDGFVVDGGAFGRDTRLGRRIIEIARRNRLSQDIYAAEELEPDGLQLFLRVYWTDAHRRDFYAVLGFLVSPESLPRMFAVLHERSLAALLTRRGGDIPLEMRVTDDRGRVVYGSTARRPEAAKVSVQMLFYPAARIERRVVTSGVTPRLWQVEVSAALKHGVLFTGYWPTVFSVVFMLGAFGLTFRANRSVAEVARKQAEFMAHASHQLRTPLSLISAAIETIEIAHVRSPEKLSQYLCTIRNEAKRLASLVQRILEFSRVEQARALELQEVQLGSLVRATVEAFEQSLSAQRFIFVVDGDDELHVLADPAAIEQVLGNLLDNAVKHGRAARTVRVRVARAGSEALIEVIDRGPGISRHDHERIFEKFYRGPASAGTQGFGLGLPIVRELVRAHHGRVEVDGAPGLGSTFRVILPAIHTERRYGSSDEPMPTGEAVL